MMTTKVESTPGWPSGETMPIMLQQHDSLRTKIAMVGELEKR